jgi:hypothetical protein
MTTTDCAKCEATGKGKHEQKDGTWLCDACERKRKAQSEAARVLGSLGCWKPKNFKPDEIERRKEQMRKIGIETQARRRALVAEIVAKYKETPESVPKSGPIPTPIPALEPAASIVNQRLVNLPKDVADAVAEWERYNAI